MTAPDALVWALDGRPHEGIDYSTRLVERLEAAGVRVARVVLEQRSPTAQELSAPVHVLSGGTTLATEDIAWLRTGRQALEEPLLRASTGEALVLGVCLGAQILAERLLGPGATAPSAAGLEIGLEALHSVREGWASYEAVPQFHYYEVLQDAVHQRPDAALVLSSRHSQVQAFTVGEHVLGVQAHPELTVDDVERLVHHNADLLRQFGLHPRRVAERVHERAGLWSSEAVRDLMVTPAQVFLGTGRGPGARTSG